jgi:TolB-like protein/AraC-like DNA-binding protein
MTEPRSPDQIFIDKLTEIVLANLGNEKFGINEFAQATGISRQRLSRKLYSITTKTIHQFILETRLNKALEILKNEDLTSSEVAFKTGFSSPSHFNSSFHKYFGLPPGKVKKSVSAGAEEPLVRRDNLEQKRHNISWRIIAIISGISLALFLMIFYAYAANHRVNPEISIAVLPFINLSNDITDQYIYDGVLEEIFNNLGKIKELRVISHTSVEQFRNTKTDAREIGKDLDVNYIVEGSGQKIGSHSILRVQLIEVPADKHIWTGSYDLEFMETADLFRQISRIAQSIASEVGATITPDEKGLIEKIPTQNKMAYNLYQKANSYEKEYEKNRDLSSYHTAVNLYNAALEIDTAFARAYSGLALAYWSRYYSESYFKQKFLDSCITLADKALLFDDRLDEAYYIKGSYFREKGEIEKALKNYDKALEINPNYSLAYIYRGTMLAYISFDYIKGLDNFYKALDLTRGSDRTSMLFSLVNLYYNCGFFEKAKYFLEEATKLSGDSSRYFFHLSWMEFGQGNFEEALKYHMRINMFDSTYIEDQLIYDIPPGHLNDAYNHALKEIENYKRSGRVNFDTYRIGFTLIQAGKFNEGESYINQHIKDCEDIIRLNREGGQKKFAQYDLACIYAFKGDKDKAFGYLEEYCNRSYSRPIEISLTKNDPMFANIRNDDRFKNLVKKMEANYQSEHDRVRRWLEKEGL